MVHMITNIHIVPVKPQDGLVAFASFVYANAFYIASVGIYTRPAGGFRLTYPTRKSAAANTPLFHPINKDIAAVIEDAVIRKYEAIMAAAR
jgi:DNA-binding cell septation regulator SpoVG